GSVLFPSSAWEHKSWKLCFPDAKRSFAACVPKQSLGTSKRGRSLYDSAFFASSIAFFCCSVTWGHSSFSLRMVSVRMIATAALATHLWSAGMTYQGAYLVLVASRHC